MPFSSDHWFQCLGVSVQNSSGKNKQIAASLNLVITGLISRNDYSIKEDTEIQVVV